MKIHIINGPNLNLLGTREPNIYGTQTFEEYLANLKTKYLDIDFQYFQSNVEGELINYLHQHCNSKDKIIINPGGYSHTSVAIADAIKAIAIPIIEVHISNIHAREPYRHHTLTGANCIGIISGLGLKGYEMGVRYFVDN